MNSGVYSITNMVTNKRYIGSSINLEQRFSQHQRYLKSDTHHNPFLQAAWNKYGAENFLFEALIRCLPEQLLSLEEEHIALHKSADRQYGYNSIAFPTQGNRGTKWSQKSKQKLSNTLKQQYLLGNRKLVSFTHTIAAKEKIAKASLGRISPNRRKVWCHQTGIEYPSIHDAAKELKVSVSGVMDVVSRNLKAVRGYTFDYVDGSLKEIRSKALPSKSVVCLETGLCYDSPSDAARDIKVAGGEIGRAIRKNKKIKGFTFIYEDENDEGRD